MLVNSEITLKQWRSQGMAEYGSRHTNLSNLANSVITLEFEP